MNEAKLKQLDFLEGMMFSHKVSTEINICVDGNAVFALYHDMVVSKLYHIDKCNDVVEDAILFSRELYASDVCRSLRAKKHIDMLSERVELFVNKYNKELIDKYTVKSEKTTLGLTLLSIIDNKGNKVTSTHGSWLYQHVLREFINNVLKV